MYIKELKDSYTLILCKMSGEHLGIIFYEDITISRGIEKISEMTFTINKYYGMNKEINPLYNELKNERFIELDDIETYVIKSVTENNDTTKTIKAYSREKKMCKSKVEFEDIFLTLKTKQNISDCYTLDDLLYNDTGWNLGYISDKVRYQGSITISEMLQGGEERLTNDEKIRYQESVSTNWYDYLTNNIVDQFECYPIFDSYNKQVHLYHESELGENLELLLSYDNYLRSNEKTTSTEEIVTRLTLIGNEDLSIVNCNPMGTRYIEDFSYYMESNEMSTDLIQALESYNIVTKKRTEEWINKRNQKINKETTYTEKQKKLLLVYNMIQSLETAIGMTEDDKYKVKLIDQLEGQIDERAILERDINMLIEEIEILSIDITNLNKLCKKEYATYENNNELIFSKKLLDELKEFIYQDIYSNDTITSDEELYKFGQKKLSELSRPTKTWSIDSVNFMGKLIDNEFRNQWSGQLGLGDMILLKGENEVECVYLVGYTQDFKNKTLQLELSNKKSNKEFSLSIGERLTMAKEAYDKMMTNKYIFNSIKLNRLGVNYDKVNRELL